MFIKRVQGQKVSGANEFDFFMKNTYLYQDFRNYKVIEIPDGVEVKGSMEVTKDGKRLKPEAPIEPEKVEKKYKPKVSLGE